MIEATSRPPAKVEQAKAIRLFINEIMNIQSTLADQRHPAARQLWHALERFVSCPATTEIIK